MGNVFKNIGSFNGEVSGGGETTQHKPRCQVSHQGRQANGFDRQAEDKGKGYP